MKVGFLSLLGLLFIALKLTHTIDWEWWLVLLPLYGPISIFLVLMAISGVCTLILRKLQTPQERSRRELSEALKGMSKTLRQQGK